LRYLFEEYEFDTDRRELHRGADVISVAPQVFDLLDYLICNRTRVVSKDELINAIWSGRSVSDAALTTRLNIARSMIGDSGDEQRLIKTLPRKGFRFVGAVHEEGRPPEAPAVPDNGVELSKPAIVLPDKPSVAVLPFQNMSGDPEQEYFTDGVAEEIITALSRFRNLFVIARNSSFTYKGCAVDVKRIGRELGVRYLLEGSVRKAGSRVRIMAQLVDTATGRNLWADRSDGDLEDIFDLQDRLTAGVVGQLAPKLEQAEIERAKRKPTESLDAYDYFLRGIAHAYRYGSRDSIGEALRLFYRAIELDPDYASAYGMAARCYSQRKAWRWTLDRDKELAETARLAHRAGEVGKDDALALCAAGIALAYVVGDLDNAAAFTERAIQLNPNLAWAWLFSGWVRAFLGEPDVAIEHQARAMRLSPLDPTLYNMQTGTALAHLLAGRFDEASSWSERAFRDQPNYPLAAGIVAASNALAGRLEQARRAIVRLRQIDPALHICNVGDLYPLRRLEDRAKFIDGFRKVGFPE
jgi:TolB-like protein/Tfp pilus assembly protein PilF